ncbi:HNH endonuclease [Williamsia herbipolensis]|uniref:HNH endonuclease n=1 Tax=Williamsia herbipolensis TaxID=1603258 RepID=UPI00082464E0|nr:HNH endonuclease signature motif containing protein [Williamsia herbipolensis]
MTAWIVTVGEDFPDHVQYGLADGFWDTRRRRDIRAGDEVFFWLSGTGLVAWVDVTSDLRELRAGDTAAHWRDATTGGYLYRFELRERQTATIDSSWKTISEATGITQLLSNGIVEVPNLAEEYFRSLFGDTPPLAPTSTRTDFQFDPDVYTPGEDTRERAERLIRLRRGQGAFRDSLLDAYGSRCAVSGSTVLPILEAAHIDRYFGDHSHHVTNGLLLRCDVHTLFDLRRLTVDDEYKVRVSPNLARTEYASLDGKALRLPSDTGQYPDQEALKRHAQSCSWLSFT